MKRLLASTRVDIRGILAKHGLFALVLIGIGVLSLTSCRENPNAILLITDCTDQDKQPLSISVDVDVEGFSTKQWQPGQSLSFPIAVKGDRMTVAVNARTQQPYIFQAGTDYTVRRGDTTEVKLRFFNPYEITIEAVGRDGRPLQGVDVSANDVWLGKTNASGLFNWRVEQAESEAGQFRVDARFIFTLNRDNKTVSTDPLTIRPRQFRYTARAELDLRDENPPPPLPSYTVTVTSNEPELSVTLRNRTTNERHRVRVSEAVALEQGTYTWNVAETDTYYAGSGSFAVDRDRQLDIEVRLKPPSYAVRVQPDQPGVVVTIRNVETGEQQQVRGDETLTLHQGSYRWNVAETDTYFAGSGTFAVDRDRQLDIEVRLKPPSSYTVTFQVTQPDAAVTIRNEATGVEQPVSEQMNLVAGSYRWDVAESDAYEAGSGTFTVDGNRRVDIEVRLKPTPALTPEPTPELPTPEPTPPEQTPEPTPRVASLEMCDEARASGHYADAEQCYKDFGNNPEYARSDRMQAHMSMGRMLYLETKDTRDHLRAIAAFEEVLKLDKSEYAAHYNLAIIHEARKDYNDALDHLNKLIALKHHIPVRIREERMVRALYLKSRISYEQFKAASTVEARQDLAGLSKAEWQNFLDMLPSGLFTEERKDAEDKIGQLRRWLELNPR